MLRRTINPDLYHGHNKRKNFFEGWYFKLIDATEHHAFSFIPGIFYGKNTSYSHSFIQILNGGDVDYSYLKYSVNDFSASKKSFSLKVNGNTFTKNKIALNIDSNNIKINGEVRFSDIRNWPSTSINPGSMGFYNFIPHMQCYSQVCTMDMKLLGSLNINGEEIDLTGGRGYIEKNWGSSFPYSWIWVQCNNFRSSNTSLTCSIAHIPFLSSSFRGFLIGISIENKFYKFTTMNKSKLHTEQVQNNIFISCENKNYLLKIQTFSEINDFMMCYAPRDDKMIPLVGEALKGKVSVELIEKASNKMILKDIGVCTGIEYGGEQKMILNKY